ncbi:MAG: ABC transporter permease [Armatimonadota bacterium]|nr:ABC transporter permease [Armatimonadota bacterium]
MAVIAACIGTWELGVAALGVPEFILPGPSAVWAALVKWRSAIWFNAAQTLYTTLVGFALALAGGMGLGLAIGYSTLVYRALYPLLVAFNSVPKVAIVPVLVIWFGIGTIPAIITAFAISFFPIVVNVATGLATLEPEWQDVLRSLGASRWDIFVKIGIPRSLPYFFASLKVAATLAFVGAVISETVAANRGIGYLMISASARFEVPLVFAGLVVVAAMGVALFAVFAVVEQRLAGWAYRGGAIIT